MSYLFHNYIMDIQFKSVNQGTRFCTSFWPQEKVMVQIKGPFVKISSLFLSLYVCVYVCVCVCVCVSVQYIRKWESAP